MIIFTTLGIFIDLYEYWQKPVVLKVLNFEAFFQIPNIVGIGCVIFSVMKTCILLATPRNVKFALFFFYVFFRSGVGGWWLLPFMPEMSASCPPPPQVDVWIRQATPSRSTTLPSRLTQRPRLCPNSETRQPLRVLDDEHPLMNISKYATEYNE